MRSMVGGRRIMHEEQPVFARRDAQAAWERLGLLRLRPEELQGHPVGRGTGNGRRTRRARFRLRPFGFGP